MVEPVRRSGDNRSVVAGAGRTGGGQVPGAPATPSDSAHAAAAPVRNPPAKVQIDDDFQRVALRWGDSVYPAQTLADRLAQRAAQAVARPPSFDRPEAVQNWCARLAQWGEGADQIHAQLADALAGALGPVPGGARASALHAALQADPDHALETVWPDGPTESERGGYEAQRAYVGRYQKAQAKLADLTEALAPVDRALSLALLAARAETLIRLCRDHAGEDAGVPWRRLRTELDALRVGLSAARRGDAVAAWAEAFEAMTPPMADAATQLNRWLDGFERALSVVEPTIRLQAMLTPPAPSSPSAAPDAFSEAGDALASLPPWVRAKVAEDVAEVVAATAVAPRDVTRPFREALWRWLGAADRTPVRARPFPLVADGGGAEAAPRPVLDAAWHALQASLQQDVVAHLAEVLGHAWLADGAVGTPAEFVARSLPATVVPGGSPLAPDTAPGADVVVPESYRLIVDAVDEVKAKRVAHRARQNRAMMGPDRGLIASPGFLPTGLGQADAARRASYGLLQRYVEGMGGSALSQLPFLLSQQQAQFTKPAEVERVLSLNQPRLHNNHAVFTYERGNRGEGVIKVSPVAVEGKPKPTVNVNRARVHSDTELRVGDKVQVGMTFFRVDRAIIGRDGAATLLDEHGEVGGDDEAATRPEGELRLVLTPIHFGQDGDPITFLEDGDAIRKIMPFTQTLRVGRAPGDEDSPDHQPMLGRAIRAAKPRPSERLEPAMIENDGARLEARWKALEAQPAAGEGTERFSVVVPGTPAPEGEADAEPLSLRAFLTPLVTMQPAPEDAPVEGAEGTDAGPEYQVFVPMAAAPADADAEAEVEPPTGMTEEDFDAFLVETAQINGLLPRPPEVGPNAGLEVARAEARPTEWAREQLDAAEAVTLTAGQALLVPGRPGTELKHGELPLALPHHRPVAPAPVAATERTQVETTADGDQVHRVYLSFAAAGADSAAAPGDASVWTIRPGDRSIDLAYQLWLSRYAGHDDNEGDVDLMAVLRFLAHHNGPHADRPYEGHPAVLDLDDLGRPLEVGRSLFFPSAETYRRWAEVQTEQPVVRPSSRAFVVPKQGGQTLADLSARYGVSVARLQAANPDYAVLSRGADVTIPSLVPRDEDLRVKVPAELSADGLARHYHVPFWLLQRYNDHIRHPGQVQLGTVTIPALQQGLRLLRSEHVLALQPGEESAEPDLGWFRRELERIAEESDVPLSLLAAYQYQGEHSPLAFDPARDGPETLAKRFSLAPSEAEILYEMLRTPGGTEAFWRSPYLLERGDVHPSWRDGQPPATSGKEVETDPFRVYLKALWGSEFQLVVPNRTAPVPDAAPVPFEEMPLSADQPRHSIEEGEDLFILALRYGVSPEAFVRVNWDLDMTQLEAGTEVRVPERTASTAWHLSAEDAERIGMFYHRYLKEAVDEGQLKSAAAIRDQFVEFVKTYADSPALQVSEAAAEHMAAVRRRGDDLRPDGDGRTRSASAEVVLARFHENFDKDIVEAIVREQKAYWPEGQAAGYKAVLSGHLAKYGVTLAEVKTPVFDPKGDVYYEVVVRTGPEYAERMQRAEVRAAVGDPPEGPGGR